MNDPERIKTVIIDEDRHFLCLLREQLEMFPEIELKGCAAQYYQAKRLLLTERPELVFVNVDMHEKDGFELLAEIRSLTTKEFSVIFYTDCEKYVIRALRESAFDCILKPIRDEELCNAIRRFREKRAKVTENSKFIQQSILYFSEMVSLPTHIGIRFVDMSKIVFFQCARRSVMDKPCWEVVLNDEEHIKLKKSTTSKEILNLVKGKFTQINPAVIVNLNYINVVEFKTQECVLIPPFHDRRFKVSRSQMTGIREKYDVL